MPGPISLFWFPLRKPQMIMFGHSKMEAGAPGAAAPQLRSACRDWVPSHLDLSLWSWDVSPSRLSEWSLWYMCSLHPTGPGLAGGRECGFVSTAHQWAWAAVAPALPPDQPSLMRAAARALVPDSAQAHRDASLLGYL